jgi:hypothetical protein
VTVREVCFLIGADDSILWADIGVGPVALPDSRRRWEQIWRLRGDIGEISHSHPVGPSEFSTEDRTTMAAIDVALGRWLRYSVVTGDAIVRSDSGQAEGDEEPWWTSVMRAASGILPHTEGE